MEPRVLTHDVVGDGDPVVLVPGGLTGWLSWIPHVESLRDSYRTIRVQPIHNELGSAGQPGDPTYSAVVERESLLLTLDALDVDVADFAGWSSGGRALLEFAIAYPERVQSLTLVEPAAHWILEQLDEIEGEEPLHDLAGHEVSEDDLARFLAAAGLARTEEEAREHPGWEGWLDHRMALSWQSPALDHPERSVEELSAVQCPVLLIKGSESDPRDRRIVDVLGERFGDARIVELQGDHACHIESIDRFLEELETHLARR